MRAPEACTRSLRMTPATGLSMPHIACMRGVVSSIL